MIIFGYAKEYRYGGDGALLIKVRIPVIHGPFDLNEYRGRTAHNYVQDNDLPWFPSILLPHLPNDGEVVVVETINESKNDFVIIGLTGASYYTGATNIT